MAQNAINYFTATLAPNAEGDEGEEEAGVVRVGLPHVADFRYTANFTTFIAENGLTAGQEAIVAYLLIRAAKNVPGVTLFPGVEANARFVVNRQGAGAQPWDGAGDLAAGEALSDDITVEHVRTIIAAMADHRALGWLIDLTAAHQVKPLDARNIAGYFQSVGRIRVNGNILLKVVSAVAFSIPAVCANAGLLALVSRAPWIDYHTCFASTPSLADEAIKAYPVIADMVLDGGERAAVTAAVRAKHDPALCRAISNKTILFTYAYLVAHSKLPSNWFQGEKAKATMPGVTYARYLAGMNRAKGISTNLEEITNAATLADIGALLQ